MKYLANFLSLVACSFVISVATLGQIPLKDEKSDITFDDPQADAAAVRGLATLKQLITPQDYMYHNLKSFEEVSQLTLGEGAPVFYVYDDDLVNFSRTTNLADLLKNVNTRIYPILINGEGRILMTLRKQGGEWQKPTFDQYDVASNLAKLRVMRKALSLPNVTPIAVQLPTMHLSFATFGRLTKGNSGDLRLIPLNSRKAMAESPGFRNNNFLLANPHFDATIDGSLGARDVFDALASGARSTEPANAPGP